MSSGHLADYSPWPGCPLARDSIVTDSRERPTPGTAVLLIEALLPPDAVGVVMDGPTAFGPLLDTEAALVASASLGRRQEFTAGRTCAREALARLGWPGFAVLAGPHREPLWPPGILGSVTHCPGYCAAAVARSGRLLGLGIDAEPNVALDAHLRRRVAHPGELAAVGPAAGVDAALLIFSAKEAAFKAWYPLTHRWLELLDVCVRVDTDRRVFDVRRVGAVEAPEGATGADVVVRGRWVVTGTHLGTVATVEPRSGSSRCR